MDASALRRLDPRRHFRLAAFVVLLVAAGSTFALTEAGHYSTYTAQDMTAEVTGYQVSGSGDDVRLEVQIRVHNELLRPVSIESTQLGARADGDFLTGTAHLGEKVTVPPGETATLSVSLEPNVGRADRLVDAAAAGNLTVSGVLSADMERYNFQIDVGDEGATDD